MTDKFDADAVSLAGTTVLKVLLDTLIGKELLNAAEARHVVANAMAMLGRTRTQVNDNAVRFLLTTFGDVLKQDD